MADSGPAEGPGPGWRSRSAATEEIGQCLRLGGSVGAAPQENNRVKAALRFNCDVTNGRYTVCPSRLDHTSEPSLRKHAEGATKQCFSTGGCERQANY